MASNFLYWFYYMCTTKLSIASISPEFNELQNWRSERFYFIIDRKELSDTNFNFFSSLLNTFAVQLSSEIFLIRALFATRCTLKANTYSQTQKVFLFAANREISHAFDLCAGKSRHCKYFLMPHERPEISAQEGAKKFICTYTRTYVSINLK